MCLLLFTISYFYRHSGGDFKRSAENVNLCLISKCKMFNRGGFSGYRERLSLRAGREKHLERWQCSESWIRVDTNPLYNNNWLLYSNYSQVHGIVFIRKLLMVFDIFRPMVLRFLWDNNLLVTLLYQYITERTFWWWWIII